MLPRLARYRLFVYIALVLAVFMVALIYAPGWLYASFPDDAAKTGAISTLRTGILASLIGVGALGTFWMNYRSTRINAETLRISVETLRISERGHISDRFARAIDLLGHERLMVRLGGIHSLEHIGKDSPVDLDAVVEVLSAFVRTEATHPHSELRGGHIPKPRTDIQTAINVLGRLPQATDVVADFTGAYLCGYKFVNLVFTDARFLMTNLQYVTFQKSLFQRGRPMKEGGGCRFEESSFTHAKVVLCEFTDAVFRVCDLHQTEIEASSFANTIMSHCDLSSTKFTKGRIALSGDAAREYLASTSGDSPRVVGKLSRLPGDQPRPPHFPPEKPRFNVHQPGSGSVIP